MDHKTWLWRKKSSEKTIIAAHKVDISLKRINEEERMHPMEGGRDRVVKNLNEKLASVLLDNHGKDDLVTKNIKMAPVANPGREMAEADVISLKKELDEALRQGNLANENLTHSEVAWKECMQQLDFVRDEQERRIRDAVVKTSSEFEKAQRALRDKLTETNRRLEELTIDNSRLSKALLVKEKLIEEQQKHKSQSEAEFGALMDRLDLTEKENAFLKYEFHVLEKELEIRHEEMEYNRRSSDLAHKKHLHGVKKIAKLETECQKLRLLLQKRLPGPASVVKMKNEVEMLGKDKSEMRRTKLNPTRDLILSGSTAEYSSENPAKNINLLLEQLHIVEEENKSEALTVQLHELKESIGSLQAELNMFKESKEMIEDQVENQKSINEDLDTQLTVAKAKLNEIFQKCSSLEVELEYKNSCCEELEATCLELQLQLESVAENETPKYVMNQEGKQSQNGWEITAASVKLAECQETILNLGKQLKVLATPHDAVLFDKVFSNGSAATTALNSRRISKHLSLRDRMLADDGGKADVLKSPKSQGTLRVEAAYFGPKRESTNSGIMALAIVPSEKHGAGLLRRLLFRRKKGCSKKSRIQN